MVDVALHEGACTEQYQGDGRPPVLGACMRIHLGMRAASHSSASSPSAAKLTSSGSTRK